MPFCPKCRREYREGIKTCYYCETDLVATPPEGNEESPARRAKPVSRHLRIAHDYASPLPLPLGEPDYLETVADFYSEEEGLRAHSVLESHGINGTLIRLKTPEITRFIPGKKIVARLQVKHSSVEAAQMVLKAVQNLPENKTAACPQCASKDISKTMLSANWKCRACGFSWRPSKENQE